MWLKNRMILKKISSLFVAAVTLYLCVFSSAYAIKVDIKCDVETGTRFRSKARIEVYGLKPAKYKAAIRSGNGAWVYSKPRKLKGHAEFYFDSHDEPLSTPISETFIIDNAIQGQLRDVKTGAQIIKPTSTTCDFRTRD